MRAYVQTRGFIRDYRFLGTEPQAWWREFARLRLTSFEEPSLLVGSDRDGWRVYAGGIASCRQDRTGTTIRYTLVVEGGDAERTDDDIRPALGLVQAWLAGHDGSNADETLSVTLDRHFDVDTVERLVTAGPEDSDAEVADVAARALAEVAAGEIEPREPREPGGPGGPGGPREPGEAAGPAGPAEAVDADPAAEPAPGHTRALASRAAPPTMSWVARADDAGARAALLTRVEELLAGDRGWALRLNLAGTDDVAAIGRDRPEPLAVLVDDDLPAGLSTLATHGDADASGRDEEYEQPEGRERADPKARPPLRRTRPEWSQQVSVVAAGLALAILIILIILLVPGLDGRTPSPPSSPTPTIPTPAGPAPAIPTPAIPTPAIPAPTTYP